MFFLTAFILQALNVLNAQGILNAYAKITTINGARTTLTVSNVNETNHTFSVGDQVIVMQMQDDCIGTNTTNVATFGDLGAIGNAGVYEIRTIASRVPASGTPTSITLGQPLTNTFNTGANSSVQLISYRNLGASYTTTANITGLAWDGNVGGVIAIRVTNTLTLNHSITANGIGFRRGNISNPFYGPVCGAGNSALYISNANQAFKGEGIYKSTNAAFSNSRGKILNGGGGGGDHNGGGGGGGNFSAGGTGGAGWDNCTSSPGGGLGGISLSAFISGSRIFMGGGGGGGQQDNGNGGNGGEGGGIILLRAQVLASGTTCASSPQITANGITPADNAGIANDAVGGGGAAGSIICQVASYSISATCPLSISANGGNGAVCLFSSSGGSVGGGGGGGQGAIVFSTTTPTVNVTATTTNGTPGADNNAGYTTGTAGGGTNNTGIIQNSTSPLPVEMLYFEALCNEQAEVELSWATATEKNNHHFTIEKSEDAIHWNETGTVNGAGNSSQRRNYRFTDAATWALSYYRLKQTDPDQKSTYSKIISVDCGELAHSPAYIHPNPASGELHVTGDGIRSVEIIDCLGQLVRTEILQRTSNGQTLMVNGIADGLYTVRILYKNNTLHNLKFIKH
jgi:hypothetical protein